VLGTSLAPRARIRRPFSGNGKLAGIVAYPLVVTGMASVPSLTLGAMPSSPERSAAETNSVRAAVDTWTTRLNLALVDAREKFAHMGDRGDDVEGAFRSFLREYLPHNSASAKVK